MELNDVLAGVDVGGTSIDVAVGTRERGILGRGSAASKPHRAAGIRAAAIAIGATVKRTLLASHLGQPDVLVAGIAGAGDPARKQELWRALDGTGIARRIQVCTDAEVALFDAFGSDAGIVVVAGTGSIVMGRLDDGELVRAGGLGPASGDPGSAFALGRAALASSLDGSLPRELATRFRFEGRPGAPELRPDLIAAAAPSLLHLAADGNANARTLVVDGARALANLVAEVMARWRGDPPGAIALSGGLFRSGVYVTAVMDAVHELGLGVMVRPEPADPPRGAFRFAASL